ncbi:hypothetical protein DLM46_37250 [Paraburkholderia lacunae]|uniref:Uncharacterized protein n=1 Tax=Paraburkholderia lacunae TaxID=2211104 RepID=A0A370MW11_9BURK|nr:hypothetical protein DLM46_37250 [Paraburkholderia lacunae]
MPHRCSAWLCTQACRARDPSRQCAQIRRSLLHRFLHRLCTGHRVH